MRRCLVAAVALALAGCAGESKVVRVYDGRVVEGEYVPPEAYAEYLRGVLAEEAGDLRSALSAYENAAREDDEDPEPLVRIGAVRCRLDPKGRGADDAFARAMQIDRTYAPALAAQARCAADRGRIGEGMALLEAVAPADRHGADLGALFVRLAAQSSGATEAARQRAIALTIANADNPVAWDALIAWGRGKGDGELLARGFEGLVRSAPARSRDVEAGALELLGIGHTGLARRVAARLADESREGASGVHDATVARLAVDEALARGDLDRAERRALRGHVPLAEVAARAVVLEHRDLADRLARRVLAADPASGCASMVLAAVASSGPASAPAPPAVQATDAPSAACVVVLAERLAALAGTEPARTWVARVTAGRGLAFAPHDPSVAPLAVDLAARGVFAEASLPIELRLELAARRREPPPPMQEAAAPHLDPKHMLLWHLLVDPTGAPARTLLSRMAGAADRDPIIGFALAREALAASSPVAWEPILRALAGSPTDPLLLAVAVELARKNGRAEDVPPARARLLAVARTPAERALATE